MEHILTFITIKIKICTVITSIQTYWTGAQFDELYWFGWNLGIWKCLYKFIPAVIRWVSFEIPFNNKYCSTGTPLLLILICKFLSTNPGEFCTLQHCQSTSFSAVLSQGKKRTEQKMKRHTEFLLLNMEYLQCCYFSWLYPSLQAEIKKKKKHFRSWLCPCPQAKILSFFSNTLRHRTSHVPHFPISTKLKISFKFNLLKK